MNELRDIKPLVTIAFNYQPLIIVASILLALAGIGTGIYYYFKHLRKKRMEPPILPHEKAKVALPVANIK